MRKSVERALINCHGLFWWMWGQASTSFLLKSKVYVPQQLYVCWHLALFLIFTSVMHLLPHCEMALWADLDVCSAWTNQIKNIPRKRQAHIRGSSNSGSGHKFLRSISFDSMYIGHHCVITVAPFDRWLGKIGSSLLWQRPTLKNLWFPSRGWDWWGFVDVDMFGVRFQVVIIGDGLNPRDKLPHQQTEVVKKISTLTPNMPRTHVIEG